MHQTGAHCIRLELLRCIETEIVAKDPFSKHFTRHPKVLCFCTELCVIGFCIPLELATLEHSSFPRTRLSSPLDRSLKFHIRASSLRPKLHLDDNQLLIGKVLKKGEGEGKGEP